MRNGLWLVLDIGTSGVKAALAQNDGMIVVSAVETYATHSAEGGIVEQSARDWWHAIVAACRSFGERSADVDAICITGQMQDLILLDHQGQPAAPVILYSDTRAKSEAAEIIDKIGAGRLLALTGNEQGADSLWAKLLWVQRHWTDRWEKTVTFLCGAADYAGFRLTGNAVTDTTTASTTGLLHVSERRWFEYELLKEMGIEFAASLLPAIVPGGTQIGTLCADAAVELNISPGIPVYHGPGDAGATTIGAGSGEIGRAYGYLGTSGWIGFTADTPGSPEQGVFTLAHPRASQYMQVAPLLTAGGNLEWIHTLFDQASFAAAIDEALARPLKPIIYLPYLNGERAPFIDPLARAAFIGIGPDTHRADMVRAVLEGVVFAYRHVLDTLMPQALDRLVLTGGGTRSSAWCQLFADALGVPIIIIRNAEHVAIRGALMSAQIGQGSRVSYALDIYPEEVTALHPDLTQHAAYTLKYRRYRAAYPALRPLFEMD